MSFKATNYLLFSKRTPELDGELLREFSPYMTARYLTFYSGGIMTQYTNDTLNTYSKVFTNVDDVFKFYEMMIPRLAKSKIPYIKRTQIQKQEEIPIPEFYCKRELEILQRMSKYSHE